MTASLCSVRGDIAAKALVPMATRSSVAAGEPSSGTAVASGSAADAGNEAALTAPFGGVAGIGTAIVLVPLATPSSEAVGVFNPSGWAAGSGVEVALTACLLRAPGTGAATPLVPLTALRSSAGRSRANQSIARPAAMRAAVAAAAAKAISYGVGGANLSARRARLRASSSSDAAAAVGPWLGTCGEASAGDGPPIASALRSCRLRSS